MLNNKKNEIDCENKILCLLDEDLVDKLDVLLADNMDLVPMVII